MSIRSSGRMAVVALAGLSLLAACTGPAGKASAPAAPAATTPPSATLQDQAVLGPDNEALPRIGAPATAQVSQINAALAARDAEWRENVAGCTDGDKAISREVSVTRNASDFLGLAMAYDLSCGGAYPSSGTDYYTYDLTTGALADWARLLPKAGITNNEPIPDYPVNTFSSAALQARLARIAEANAKDDPEWKDGCGGVYAMEGLTLQAAFSADRPVLEISPGSLPHAVQACGDTLALTVDELKALGADARLIAAVEAVGKK